MTEQEQRIAIAEYLGWNRNVFGHWQSPIDKDVFVDVDGLPDYLHDLNAMHDAEEFLSGLEWEHYFNLIQSTGKATGVRATAAQRSQAFLRTKKLWKD